MPHHSKYPPSTPCEISKIGNLYNKIVVKRSGIINHFIPYIQIYFQKSAAKF